MSIGNQRSAIAVVLFPAGPEQEASVSPFFFQPSKIVCPVAHPDLSYPV